MKITAIIVLIGVALAATAGAQGTPSTKPVGPGASPKAASEIRSLVHELQGHTGKLADLNAQYRSHVEQRPQGNDAQHAKWEAALERLLGRIDVAHKAVVDSKQRLEQAITGQTLSTSLGKDVANARNEADAERASAEQALAKTKGKGKAGKQGKPKPAEKAPPPLPDDLDL